jgi:phosphinothricin acetyltransferase
MRVGAAIDNIDITATMHPLEACNGRGHDCAMNLTIRFATEDDAAALARIYAASVIGGVATFETTPPDAPEMAARVRKVLPHAPWLVCGDGSARGFAYASRHRERAAYRWAIDVSVYVDEHYRRRGIARALYASLLAMVRLQGFYSAHAGITQPNPASVALHESFGFAPVGVYRAVGFKHGAWHDVGWWQLALRAAVDAPAEPRTPEQLAADPRWHDAMTSGLSLSRSDPGPALSDVRSA